MRSLVSAYRSRSSWLAVRSNCRRWREEVRDAKSRSRDSRNNLRCCRKSWNASAEAAVFSLGSPSPSSGGGVACCCWRMWWVCSGVVHFIRVVGEVRLRVRRMKGRSSTWRRREKWRVSVISHVPLVGTLLLRLSRRSGADRTFLRLNGEDGVGARLMGSHDCDQLHQLSGRADSGEYVRSMRY